MTATTVTTNTDDKPHLMLAGLAQQAAYAYRYAKAGQTTEALEHAGAIERLITAYRLDVGDLEPEAIHLHFGLSYGNYLVLPRTLLQSMPDAWQARFVALVDEMAEAFRHVPQADAYKVEAAEEHTVSEMNQAQLKAAGVIQDWYAGEQPPEGISGEDLAEWQNQHEQLSPDYYDADGNELDEHSRVLLAVSDPVPHYNRGRARIEPRLGGGE